MPICHFKPIETAHVSSQNQSPFSEQFDDIYFNPEHGLDETEHVFIHGNKLIERFSKLEPNDIFTVAETGFGTGLNFLAAWQTFENHAPQSAQLIFISLEKYPLRPEQLASLKTHFPALSDKIDALLKAYPSFSPGLHHCRIADNISLQLFYGDIELAMEQMEFEADAWFLDGFSPAKNEAMWQESVFQKIGKKSKQGGSIATFTAAGFVRRGLQAAGFEMSKQKGFRHKREMLVGTYHQNKPDMVLAAEKPWFKSGSTHSVKQVAIIGAGLAGCSTAYYLSQAGFETTIFEKQPDIAKGTSKNRAGILHTSFSHSISNQSHYYWQSYIFALKELQHIIPDWQPDGIIYFAKDDKEKSSFEKALRSDLYPKECWQFLDHSELEQQFELTAEAAIYLEQSGHLEPRKLCKNFIEQSNCLVKTQTEIRSINFDEGDSKWQLTDADSNNYHFDAIVLANAKAANTFISEDVLPLQSLRGQISLAEESQIIKKPAISICGDGYVTPAIEGKVTFGASYNLKDDNIEPTLEDNKDNIDKLHRLIGTTSLEAEQLEAQVGFRCHTSDYFPVVGPVPDKEPFLKAYDDIRYGRLKKPFSTGHFLPNLYVNLALGSRGLTQCFINAKLLQCQLQNLPLPIEYDIVNSMHPARFLYRQLKRNEVNNA